MNITVLKPYISFFYLQVSGGAEVQPFVSPTYEVAQAATIRPMSPPPNYGMATQYSTASTYNTVTSIQGDK